MQSKRILKTLAFDPAQIEALEEFSRIEGRPIDALLREAIDVWIDAKHKALTQRSLQDENAQTNLSYDEFWDGVELE